MIRTTWKNEEADALLDACKMVASQGVNGDNLNLVAMTLSPFIQSKRDRMMEILSGLKSSVESASVCVDDFGHISIEGSNNPTYTSKVKFMTDDDVKTALGK
jgi:hypothetical protein